MLHVSKRIYWGRQGQAGDEMCAIHDNDDDDEDNQHDTGVNRAASAYEMCLGAILAGGGETDCE